MITALTARWAALMAAGWARTAARVVFWLLVIAACLTPFYACYRWGAHATALRYERQIAEMQAKAASDRAAAIADARREEHDAAQASIAATEARMRAEKEENDALQADLTALRGGTLRLRQRLAAGRCADLDVRADAADPGRIAQARTAGLQAADAELLLRTGADADRISRKLAEAQAQLKICESLNR